MSILIIFLLSFFSHCSKSVDPEDEPRIEVAAEYINATEVWLRISMVNVTETGSFSLERNGQNIISGQMIKADTLVIDTLLLPKRTYTYKAYQFISGSTRLTSDPLQVTTLDTTSHIIQWQVDTLGVRGTINDVWAFSRDNIWAVGEIYLRDSTGKEDPVLYNAARYDGNRWQSFRVPTRSVGGSTGSAMLRTIFCFSPTDIWVFAYHGAYAHWNGIQWETQLGTGGETKLWGSKPYEYIYCWKQWFNLTLRWQTLAEAGERYDGGFGGYLGN
ncbi:MAG: hypothetical protein V1799_06035 [bacterium]